MPAKSKIRKEYHIGCSGFHYGSWKNVFYPEGLPSSKMFEYYCGKFSTVELNVTFYRFPTKEMLGSWHRKSPAEFTFSVKAPRLITHYRRLKQCKTLVGQFYDVAEKGLKEKLGCLLFQFPPGFKYSIENADLIFQNLRPGYQNVVEFRDASWWNKKFYSELKKQRIIFCNMDHPWLPTETSISLPVTYFRMHGKPVLFHSNYSRPFLKNLFDLLQSKRTVKTAYIYFNNTDEGNAIMNAFYLKKLSGESR